MKYLVCQPDTHNGFVSLIALKLTYFTVERAGQFGTGEKSVAINDTRGSTLIHVHSALSLPDDFAAAPLCFSLANRSLYGIDMAFIASYSGLAAVAVMSSCHLVYAPDRSPRSLRNTSETARSPSTVTWMRDKPLVFVGFLSGCVEWYHVTLSTARHQEALQSQSPIPSQKPPQKQQQQQQRQKEHDAVEQTHYNGNGDGIRVQLCHSGSFPDTGAFLTSDWFPATGYVVAGAERAVYVFASEKPGVPMHCISLAGSAALACHPFLPIVGCLSFGRAAKDETLRDACVCHVYEWTGSALRVAVTTEVDETAPPRVGAFYSCSWKFSADLCLAVSNVVEGRLHVVHLSHAETEAEADGLPSLLSSTRSLSLPLHSLVNVEFISAATSALVPLATSLSSSLTLSQDTPLPVVGHSTMANGSTKNVQLKENALVHQMLIPFGRFKGRGDRLGFVGSSTEARRNKVHTALQRCPVVLPGSGAFSSVVGMNGAGEVAVVLADADATAAPLGKGHIAVGIGSTVCIATLASSVCGPGALVRAKRSDTVKQEAKDLYTEQETHVVDDKEDTEEEDEVNGDGGMAQRMRRRLAAGFGTSAEENVRALRHIRGEADLRVLFAYIAILEHVGVVGASEAVPSMIDLLSLQHAPSTVQLSDLKLLPHHAPVVCPSSTSDNDSRRLLLLHVLDWLPAPQSDAQAPSSFSHTHTHGSPSQTEFQSHAPSALSRAALERRVAVEVLHRRWTPAAQLLRSHHCRDPAYRTWASLLQCRELTGAALREALEMLQEEFFAPLSPWLRVAFRFVQLVDTTESRGHIYDDAELPLWDRIAVAVLLESNTPKLAAWLRGTIARECSLAQRLLLDGISAVSCPLMQRIVDCTADFQLAACLFARVGATAGAGVRKGAPVTDNETVHTYEAAASAWDMWATAYRTFLNDEQEFVKRTTFDLACQQLASAQRGLQTSELRLSPSSTLSPLPAPAERQAQMLAWILVGHRHCSVCAAPVAVRRQCARDSFASCTVCLHGGHANHLQEWFARHRTCPVDTCSCRCDHDGNMSWKEG